MKLKTLPGKILSILILLLCSITNVIAQQYQTQIQNQFEIERAKNKWQASDIKDWKITDQYRNRTSGLTHIYIQQQYQNIPVHNALSICVVKDNDIVYFKPGLFSDIQNKINSTQAAIEAEAALINALEYLEKNNQKSLQMISSNLNENLYVYESPEISSKPIQVKLVYKPVEDEIRLAWDVSIEMKNEPHWWNIRIDAMTGEYIDKNDYTVECNFEESHSHATQEFQVEEFYNPPPPPPIGATPSYRVFPYPVEAPTFGNRSLLIDPSSALASPYGWHDIDGVAGEEYSITKGNNVFSYEDINNDDLPGYSPDGGNNLVFDYPFVLGATPSANQDAALTNLFYACNTIHDYLYPLGFTEVTGNFQKNNYGNPGLANDEVIAEGLDGGGMNNANFSTPPDGGNGAMQMYFWTGNTAACTSLSISSSSFTGSMTIGTAAFSASASVSAQVILVNDAVSVVTDACSPILNSIAGKIVLIDRGGGCSFISKAQMAQNGGAVGVIIANNVSGVPPTMTGSPVLSIPCVSISLADGNTLKAALLSGVVNATVSTCTVNPIDGSFDNKVIAHEYGHGVSNRLTGGPSTTSCLSNAEQGGEGWSDWLALMMTIEPGDQGSDARSIGSFVRGQTTSGSGIRRFPYSTNMSINPQTYASLATSAGPHQVGEIWCDAIWDMSWKLIDAHGFNSNPSNTTAGNNIAMRLVLEGMKLQPCNPGYLDARDAILTADALLYANAHRCLIWQAFAGRGMGFNALQGSADSVGDETAGFAMPPFCLPATSNPVAAFTSNVSSISCGGSINFIDQSTQAFNWNWNFGDGTTSILQNPIHVFSSPGTYIVKLVVSNPLGSDSVTHNINVTPTFTANATASPTTICGGTSVNLNATATGSNNKSYAVTSIPYAPLTGTPTSVTLTDDQMSTIQPIGFTFNFYGQNYTDFYICSNGFITFSPGIPANLVYGEPIPSITVPNNIIALAWNDLNPANAGSSVNYFTLGTAPNRKLVVNYSTSHFLSATSPFVIQAILYEGSNEIEIHTTAITNVAAFDNNATTTQGIENILGTSAVTVPGRNSSLFGASNDAYRFTPFTPYTYIWFPGNLTGASQTVNPLSTSTYSVQVTDGTACVSTFIAPTITVDTCPVNLNLTAYIEGYYAGGGNMVPTLFNEGVSTNQNIVDSIKIELHQATSPFGMTVSADAILNINGTTTAILNTLPGSYYIVIKHRNGLQTWSANPVNFNSSSITYNFSTSSSQAYGSNQKQVESGVWAIYSGDLLQDENIDLLDYQILDLSISNFDFGYFATDMNGDGNVDLLDALIIEININSFIFSNHP